MEQQFQKKGNFPSKFFLMAWVCYVEVRLAACLSVCLSVCRYVCLLVYLSVRYEKLNS